MTDDVYKLHTLSTPADVPLLANWLNANGRGVDALGVDKAIAVAVRHGPRKKPQLAFATPNEVLVLDLKSDVSTALLGVCKAILIEQQQITLRSRDAYHDIVDLTQFFAKQLGMKEREVYYNMAPTVIGDLKGAGDVIGLPVQEKQHFKRIADDAYEVALYGPQYEHAIQPFYGKVSLPYARLRAEGSLFGSDPARYDWWVDMPELWLRTFAHFSSDPTLGRAFQEGWNIAESFARVLKVTEIEAMALLMWQAHDRDMEALSKRYPLVINHLPAELPYWVHEMDLHFPSMCASTIQMRQAYWESRAAHTLYGRLLRPGRSPGEASAFRIFGTVEDIIKVACVTYWQSRISHEVMITSIEGTTAAPHIRIKGEGPSAGKEMWRQVLQPLAGLSHPMTVDLAPQVVFS